MRGLMNFVKGAGIGIALGCVAGAVANQYVHSGKRGMKKTVGKAMKNLSVLVEDIGDMM